MHVFLTTQLAYLDKRHHLESIDLDFQLKTEYKSLINNFINNIKNARFPLVGLPTRLTIPDFATL